MVSKNKISINAFTLAEVLIVLGIIGLIADMTIPTLVQSYREKVIITKLIKFQSELSQAILMNESISGENTAPEIIKQLRVSKICSKTYIGCADNVYKLLNGNAAAFGRNDSFVQNSEYAILNDGSILRYGSIMGTGYYVAGATKPLMNVIAECAIDVNGNEKPNVAGKDVFYFHLTKYGAIPYGTEADTLRGFADACIDGVYFQGVGCAAWVIYNGNMDYLHCDDLSWTGKKKCD